ncbi:MAG: hypothetical protein HY319_01145 [Armatimonadetes bacterium]|nr:hypothetical protein [Armatimonadota bacterium]
MIHTITSPVSPAASRAASTPQPAICPRPMPQQPPAESVDLSTIDTPQKVAQLPIFEPTFQLGIAGAVAVAIFSAFGGGPAPAIHLGVTGLVGDNSVLGVEYSFDLNNQESPVSAQGTVFSQDGQDVKSANITGALSFDQAAEQVGWRGQIGDAAETLTFNMVEDQANPGLRMSGSVGAVPVDVRFSILGDLEHGQEGVEGYKISGTIGDLPYETESRYQLRQDIDHLPEPKVGDTLEVATMTTRGHLGDSEISKDYTINAVVDSETSVSLVASGEGVNAGLPQVVETALTLGDLPPGIIAQG